MNVISLFNGAIPLIALQMSAIKHGDDIELVFTKVLDRTPLANDADFETAEVTDKNYWEKRSSPKIIKTVEAIFADTKGIIGDFELKFNKFYIGIVKDGIAKNFIHFYPRKNFVYLAIKIVEDEEISKKLENTGLDFSYSTRDKEYLIVFHNHEAFKNHKDIFLPVVEKAKKAYCGED